MTPICSQCRRIIPAEDINVADDVAFCRVCNLASKLSSLVHGTVLEEVDFSRPPSGAWRHGSGMGAVVGATHRSFGTALGALAISLFWNGIISIFALVAISATLTNLHVPTPDWFPAPKMNRSAMGVGMTIFLWLFLTPFLAIGAVMIATFLSAIVGRTEAQIRHGQGAIFVGVGPFGWRRRFNSENVRDVRVADRVWSQRDGQIRNKRQIILETLDGREIKFGSMLREDRMRFVASALRKELLG
jgi:hypothetical protein